MDETEMAQVKAAADVLAATPAPTQAPSPSPSTTAVPSTTDMGGLAQEARSKKDDGYGYEFSDDPLSAGGFGPNDATIRVRPGPVRTTLIRPRVDPEELARKEKLRAMFNVGGKGKPNAVSEEEFARIASLYEHIWDGDQNLNIDTAGMKEGEGDKYKGYVMDQIARMLQTPMGRKQLNYLTYGYKRDGKDVDHKTTIRAPGDKNRNGSWLDDIEARADPTDGMASSADFKDIDGKHVLQRYGKGSDSIVQFNYPSFAEVGNKRSDVVLAHELTHSLTQIMGAEDMSRVDFEDGIPNDVSGSWPLFHTEHQATGLGKYHDHPMAQLNINERQYIKERNAIGGGVGVDGFGEIQGDDALRPRESYRDHPR